MTIDELYDLWAPVDSRWSPWVKPVLFAWISAVVEKAAPIDLSEWSFEWLDRTAKDTALIVDAPGAESVALGMRFAALGFRPTPLYNALPWDDPQARAPHDSAPPLVDVATIVYALRAASAELARMSLEPDAPPAFLLDSRRRVASRPVQRPYFDNRSMCFPSDFPSANFLLANGIRRVVVLQRDRHAPEADLTNTLRGWAERSVAVELKRAGVPGHPLPCDLPQPNFVERLCQRFAEVFGYRRSILGGFGGEMLDPSAG